MFELIASSGSDNSTNLKEHTRMCIATVSWWITYTKGLVFWLVSALSISYWLIWNKTWLVHTPLGYTQKKQPIIIKLSCVKIIVYTFCLYSSNHCQVAWTPTLIYCSKHVCAESLGQALPRLGKEIKKTEGWSGERPTTTDQHYNHRELYSSYHCSYSHHGFGKLEYVFNKWK